ncbi:Uncharacterized protein dnl_22980 [Desulfonema limicola]|uniref:Uncharacterized protein n=1 Tax=Desulfonema limicola TaxID=45656 RepID=A0A975B7A2_9BACT|nr:Uncharacterized protein dnl_22980 [Desulfonema limicola]
MIDENTSDVEVQFTPEFKRNLRALSKKYRNILEMTASSASCWSDTVIQERADRI